MYRLRRNAFKATQQKAFVTTFFIKMRTNKTANEISDSKGFFNSKQIHDRYRWSESDKRLKFR